MKNKRLLNTGISLIAKLPNYFHSQRALAIFLGSYILSLFTPMRLTHRKVIFLSPPMLFGETEASNPSRHMSESFGLKREEKEKKEGGGKCICVTSAQNKALYPFPELISNNQPSNLFPNIAGVSLQVVKLILAALSAF